MAALDLGPGVEHCGGIATILLVAGGHFPPVLATSLYLGMGWGVVVCYFEIARVVSHRALLPVVAGGISYSVGGGT